MLRCICIEGGVFMPIIMPIRDLRDTSRISEIAHKQQEPIRDYYRNPSHR